MNRKHLKYLLVGVIGYYIGWYEHKYKTVMSMNKVLLELDEIEEEKDEESK